MADMVQTSKKIALLHRYPADQIKQTNAAFPYLQDKGIDVLTYRKFNRLNDRLKFIKSLFWIVYAPLLVVGKGYDVIYCDDSFPFYPALVKLACPKSKVVIRLGDFHLMYYTSGWVYKFLHFFEKIEWRMVDRIIAISKVMAEYIYDEIKEFHGNRFFPYYYYPIDIVFDPVDPLDFPSANTLKYPGKMVMFHGLLTKNKNIDMLLMAAEYLPKIKFRIVGDGPDRKRLEKIAPYNVGFFGWKSFGSIYSYINDCDIGVALRSDNPGNEYVVTSPFLQYSIMGKPCLVTRRKVFGDYEWQFSTVEELIRKIKILLDKPEEGEKAKKYVLEHHDARKVADKIWSLLLS